MEFFITNLDSRITKDQLRQLLIPHLQKVNVHVFDVRKNNRKTIAQLTIANPSKAQIFLAYAAANPTLVVSPSGRCARFSRSRYSPNAQLLRVLLKEEKDLQARQSRPDKSEPPPTPASKTEDPKGLSLLSLECGRWESCNEAIVFYPYYFNASGGSVIGTGKALIIKMNTSETKRHDLVMDFSSIQSLSFSKTAGQSTLTICLTLAPKIFEDERPGTSTLLADQLLAMALGHSLRKPITRIRECGLPQSQPGVLRSCLTFRLTLSNEVNDLRKSIHKMTFDRFSILRTRELAHRTTTPPLAGHIAQLDLEISRWKCSFGLKFQLQALWTNGLLSPREVHLMLPAMDALRARSGDKALVKILSRLVLQLLPTDASTNVKDAGHKGAIAIMIRQEMFLLQEESLEYRERDEVMVHRATVTPTGICLYGPEEVMGNRVLRKYRDHQDCFLRVLFSDEDETRVELDRDVSNERILQGRFLTILRKGIDIAGEHFDFLGFSHSSLRAHTCWFMRSFIHEGRLLFAKNLVAQLGDFSLIRCPAKCAARIGQAFSETTSAVRIDPQIVLTQPDVKLGVYTFTDGCGTMSTSAWRLLKGESSARTQPTSYQIRYKGVKGMLTLDSRLSGQVINLRESMVKFVGSPSNEIEICGTNARPLPFKLNRQIIKILEDLEVPAASFENLQEQAVERLRLSARSPTSAVDFVRLQLSDSSSGLPALLRCLQKIGVDVTEDNFLRDILGALLQVQLREIKYRSRILVPSALTLYGISDETGFLEEGQIFVTSTAKNSTRQTILNTCVAVTRSPALHPGDIQLADAVVPPEGSSLRKLRNCVVFSQKGWRDLPSMLSGGDLDGDLYNVIYDPNLVPKKVVAPAIYLPAKAVDIGRTVTSDDMTGFFIDFMQNDQLGRIASLHQVLADLNGTMSPACLLLAELHSTAVDFSKSGVPVDVKQIPKAAPYRPDFMAPSASTRVEKGIQRPTELIAPEGDQRYRYYESNRILGKLYRSIDEDIFFRTLEEDTSSIFSANASDTVLEDILEWVHRYIPAREYRPYMSLAQEVRNYYESELCEFMARYTVHRSEPLTEKEVFTGTILGRSGTGSRLQREQSEAMKNRFNWGLRNMKVWMQSQTDDDEDDFLCLAAACLAHAVTYESVVNPSLCSFGWFSAGLCVPVLLGYSEDESSDVYRTDPQRATSPTSNELGRPLRFLCDNAFPRSLSSFGGRSWEDL